MTCGCGSSAPECAQHAQQIAEHRRYVNEAARSRALRQAHANYTHAPANNTETNLGRAPQKNFGRRVQRQMQTAKRHIF